MKTKFIAEVSSNHNGDLKRCKQFIKIAAAIGCDGVKFQLFKIDELFASEVLAKSEKLRKRKQWELPIAFLPELSRYAHSLGLEFSCTPFYLKAVEELKPYVDFYKIASYELLWHDLFRACARTGKPLVFSTGMATLPEIKHALNSIRGLKTKNVTVLHCSSAYPTPVREANLKTIETLRHGLNEFQKPYHLTVGFSDHTVSEEVILRAVHRYDTSMVEFHLDLDGKGEEFAAGHCWLPEPMRQVIRFSKMKSSLDGSGIKTPANAEMLDRVWRADPSDGLRPLKRIRRTFSGKLR